MFEIKVRYIERWDRLNIPNDTKMVFGLKLIILCIVGCECVVYYCLKYVLVCML